MTTSHSRHTVMKFTVQIDCTNTYTVSMLFVVSKYLVLAATGVSPVILCTCTNSLYTRLTLHSHYTVQTVFKKKKNSESVIHMMQ